MFLSKLFGILSFLGMFLIMLVFMTFSLKILSLFSFQFFKDMAPIFFFSFCLDSEMILFFFMVVLVTSLVSLYSEFYMDHYNFKKYSFLTFSFFLSMLILTSSNSFMNFLSGWDGLGLSSLCLIMFYPNKTSSYNSLVTFFFNRLGDVFLLMIFGFVYLEGSFFLFLYENYSTLLLLFFILCASTKGAQFPLSSWLPAAMSAPTPISAMVHSSTLVTAGIFVIYKFYYFFHFSMVTGLVLLAAGLTFLIGGLLASVELDLKKIVAFSTMSQISMITFFLSLGVLSISMLHMFNHALFKTLIFCSCGVLFLFNSSDQISFSVGSSVLGYFLAFPLFLSVFMMTGFQFSSSFLTKDLILECLNDFYSQFFFFILMTGSVLTLMYCGCLLNSFFHTFLFLKKKFFGFKFFSWKFLGVICLSSCLMSWMFSTIFLMSCLPIVYKSIIYLICFFMVIPLFCGPIFQSNLLYLNMELIYSKSFVFSKASSFLGKDLNSSYSSDQMFFKPFLFGLNFNTLKLETNEMSLIFLLVFLILFLNIF